MKQDQGLSQRHWIRSDSAEEHAAQLIAWSRKGFAGERDLFIARSVLQYLALEDIKNANIVFEKYLAAFASEYSTANREDGSLNSPLINFIKFCKSSSLPLSSLPPLSPLSRSLFSLALFLSLLSPLSYFLTLLCFWLWPYL